jgi:hypothetical protein
VKKSRFTEAQIVAALKEIDGGTPATAIARRLGVHADLSPAVIPRVRAMVAS